MSSRRSTSLLLGLALAGVLLPLLSGGASALSSSQQKALKSSCQSDYRAHCASVPPGGSEALQCLSQNIASLSSACQQAVSAATGAKAPAAQPASPPPAAATAPSETAAPTTAAPDAATTTTPAQPSTATTPAPTKPATTKPATTKQAKPPAAPPLTPRQEAMIVRQSCAADFRRYCGTAPLGGGNGIACLRANAARLSPGCKQALSSARR